MRFGSQMNNAIGIIVCKYPLQFIDIQNIYFFKKIVGLFLNVFKIFQITRIC